MHVDFLIIGQGICGTFLHWYLQKENKSCFVIDKDHPFTASKVAAGIINPVTGRRIVKTWLIDEVMDFAWNTYSELGKELFVDTIAQKNIIDFFPSVQMKEAYRQRYGEEPQFLNEIKEDNAWIDQFHYDFGYGEINPCFLVDIASILFQYRKRLIESGSLLDEVIQYEDLEVNSDGVRYKHITASIIIFCDGISSFQNPWFRNLPFAPNKGEVLIIEANDLPNENIFKRGLNLVPVRDNLFWVGSSYEWEFENDLPTDSFKERCVSMLKKWLKVPFNVIDHLASVRPATIERRPFIGFHPEHQHIGIFNGMGTKGCSLAPFFAQQFVQHIILKTPIYPHADIQRFKRILMQE